MLNFWLPQAIYASYSSDPSKISLSEWVAIAGACYSVFAFVVPTLHSLRLYSIISLFLTMIITFITIGISIKDGTKRINFFPRLHMFAPLVNSLTQLCSQIDEQFNVDQFEISVRKEIDSYTWAAIHPILILEAVQVNEDCNSGIATRLEANQSFGSMNSRNFAWHMFNLLQVWNLE